MKNKKSRQTAAPENTDANITKTTSKRAFIFGRLVTWLADSVFYSLIAERAANGAAETNTQMGRA